MSSLRLALKLSMEAEEPVVPTETLIDADQARQAPRKRKDSDGGPSRKITESNKEEDGKKSRSNSMSSTSDAPVIKKKNAPTSTAGAASSTVKSVAKKASSGKPSQSGNPESGIANIPSKKSGGSQSQWTKRKEQETRPRDQAGGGSDDSGREEKNDTEEGKSSRNFKRRESATRSSVSNAADDMSNPMDIDGNSYQSEGSSGNDSESRESDKEEADKDKQEIKRPLTPPPKRSHAKKRSAGRDTSPESGRLQSGVGSGMDVVDAQATPHKRSRALSDDVFPDDADTTPRYHSSRAAAQVAKEKISNKGNPRYGIIEEAVNESEFAVYRSQTKSNSRPSRSQKEVVAEPQWVQCNRCEKWRTAPTSVDLEELPEQWFCEMNTWNADLASCDAEEEVVEAAETNAEDEDYQTRDTNNASGSRSRSKSKRSRSSLGGQRDHADPQQQSNASQGYDGSLLAGTVQVLETNWVQCAKCEKWRTVPLNEADAAELPDSWECKDNVWAPSMADCEAPEEVAQDVVSDPQMQAYQQQDRSLSRGTGMRRTAANNNAVSTISPVAPAAPVAPAVVAPSQWVQCDRKGCRKWRVVPADFDMESLPEKWFCEMNTWNPDRASCDVPDDSEEEAAAKPNVRTSLILGNNKGPGTLSYRRIIFGTDGKVRPPYADTNTRGYGLFSHVEPARGIDELKHVPLRTLSYWWSEMTNDLNGPNSYGRTATAGPASGPVSGGAASSSLSGGSSSPRGKEASKSPRSPKPMRIGINSTATDSTETSLSSAVPSQSDINTKPGPEDELNGIGVRVLHDKNNNNGFTNHHKSQPQPCCPLLMAARKVAGLPNSVVATVAGGARFHKLDVINRDLTSLERAWYECVVVRSCLLAACSAAGFAPKPSDHDSEKVKAPRQKKDVSKSDSESEAEPEPASDDEETPQSDDETTAALTHASTDVDGVGGAARSISLTLLLLVIKNAYFHNLQVEAVRATFTNERLRIAVRRLEQQGEAFVSMSSCGQPCVHMIPVHMGHAPRAAPELAEFVGLPLKLRKHAARNRAQALANDE